MLCMFLRWCCKYRQIIERESNWTWIFYFHNENGDAQQSCPVLLQELVTHFSFTNKSSSSREQLPNLQYISFTTEVLNGDDPHQRTVTYLLPLSLSHCLCVLVSQHCFYGLFWMVLWYALFAQWNFVCSTGW